MSFFLYGLVCSLVVFFIIRSVFKVDQCEQMVIDTIMIGFFILLYVGLVGLISNDWVMSSLNMLGMITGVIIYRSCIGWPSGQAVRESLGRQRTKFIAAEDDPEWVDYHP